MSFRARPKKTNFIWNLNVIDFTPSNKQYTQRFPIFSIPGVKLTFEKKTAR